MKKSTSAAALILIIAMVGIAMWRNSRSSLSQGFSGAEAANDASKRSGQIGDSEAGGNRGSSRSGLQTEKDPAHIKGKISKILESSLPRDQKFNQVRLLLAELAKLEGSASSIEWLKSQVGEGTDFCIVVTGIFQGSNEPLDVLLDSLKRLPSGAVSVASTELFQKMLQSQDAAGFFQKFLSSKDAKSLEDGMNLTLELIFSQTGSLEETKSSMKSILDKLDGDARNRFERSYLSALAKQSPKDAWQELKDVPETDAGSAALRRQIAGYVRAQGVRESVDYFLKEGSTNEIADSISMWRSRNSVELQKWMDSNMMSLPASQQDGIRSGLIASMIGDKDFSSAKTEIANIADPGVRADAEQKLSDKQKALVNQSVSKEPEITVTKMVSGDSPYDAPLLEDAIHTWVKKDVNSADQWYQQHQNSLPPEQAQYVAAGFASYAVEQGDLTTALQWAGYIQDPKTKERINGMISKAGGK